MIDSRVDSIMTRDLQVLREEDNLAAIGEAMAQLEVRHLPVVDGERLVGLVSERDVLRFTVSQLEPSQTSAARDQALKSRTFVAQVMTREVETVSPDESVAKAARRLLDKRIGCLPVVDAEGRLLGILTETDLLRALAKTLEI